MMQSHFLMVRPCGCIAKIGNNFVWGGNILESNVGFWGDCQFDFYNNEEKKSCAMWVKNG
jgi:hypothetical protein